MTGTDCNAKFNPDKKVKMGEVHLSDVQQMNLKKAMKRGIYKELYKRGYLSEAQLNELIRKNT